jgi:hypothetical protein
MTMMPTKGEGRALKADRRSEIGAGTDRVALVPSI